MGTYLSTPNRDKISTDYDGDILSYGASSMQGWRATQEDAHNCEVDFDKDTSLFAVYDGHGGAEVAQYTASQLPSFLRKMELYKNNKLHCALEQGFLDFDATLLSEDVLNELKQLASVEEAASMADDSEDVNEASLLKKDAEIPLEELVQKYKAGKQSKKNQDIPETTTDGDNAGSSGGSAGSSSSNSGSTEVVSQPSENICASGSSSTHNGEVEVGSGDKKSVEEGKLSKDGAKSAEASSHGDDATMASSGSSKADENKETPDASTSSGRSSKVKKIDEDDEEDDEDDDSDSDFEAEKWKNTVEEEEEEDDDDDDDIEVDYSSYIYKLFSKSKGASEEDNDEEGEGGKTSNLMGPAMDSGCTAVVALLRNDQLYVANAGDSRCVVCRGKKAVDMSIDHKPEDADEKERIEKAGGRISFDGRVNGGLNLSRAIGDHVYKQNNTLPLKDQMITSQPEVKHLKLENEDRFMVLACDGIWNVLTSQEVVDFVQERMVNGRTLSSICEELFDFCLAPDTSGDGTGCDNMTCIIVKFNKHHPDKKLDSKVDNGVDAKEAESIDKNGTEGVTVEVKDAKKIDVEGEKDGTEGDQWKTANGKEGKRKRDEGSSVDADGSAVDPSIPKKFKLQSVDM